MFVGRRYLLPQAVAAALEQVFEESVAAVTVIECSRYARLHGGMSATTRPNRILLAIGGAEFAANPQLLLHEYYHVLCQWRTGYLTRWRYLAESVRRGYQQNRYELEAHEFAAANLDRYRDYLAKAGMPHASLSFS
jgi:hypothetical protein